MLPDSIRTARLLLRQPAMADAPALLAAYVSDPEVARFMVWRPHSEPAEVEAFLRQCLADREAGKRWAYVLELSTGASGPIGMIDARIRDRTADIGYVLARRWWRQGLMSEACRALSEALLKMPGIDRVQATCDAENVASARLLESCGFTREARLERYMVHPNLSDQPRDCFMYARCRPEATAGQR